MVLRGRLRLPEGYSAKRVDTDWHLADPRGAPIFRYPDGATVEAFAWRHARRRQPSLHDQPPGPPRDPAAALPNPKRRPPRVKRVSWRAIAAVAAGAVLAFVVGLGADGPWGRPFVAFLAPNPRPASIFAQPKPPGAVPASAGFPEVVQTATVRHRASEARYAVSIGAFRSPAAADWMKHLVRSKGFIVDVVRHGAVSQVVTTSFRTRAQAECVARGFEKIQLPAHLVAWRTM
ncbi:MAG TPA: SPOR domain-containing protein [bacterium]|nr:SPOR domain-containing protein [bacterium]